LTTGITAMTLTTYKFLTNLCYYLGFEKFTACLKNIALPDSRGAAAPSAPPPMPMIIIVIVIVLSSSAVTWRTWKLHCEKTNAAASDDDDDDDDDDNDDDDGR